MGHRLADYSYNEPEGAGHVFGCEVYWHQTHQGWCFFMSKEHPEIEIQTGFKRDEIISEYPYEAKVRLVEMRIAYDGDLFSIESSNGFEDDNTEDWQHEVITTFGWRHANLIICSLLALLESYGQAHLLNDADIQEDFSHMVQKTKDFYAEKAFEQIRDGLSIE